MQIPINTAPLKALDVPTRWLLANALEDASCLAGLQIDYHPAASGGEPLDELKRKRDTYRQIAEAIRD